MPILFNSPAEGLSTVSDNKTSEILFAFPPDSSALVLFVAPALFRIEYCYLARGVIFHDSMKCTQSGQIWNSALTNDYHLRPILNLIWKWESNWSDNNLPFSNKIVAVKLVESKRQKMQRPFLTQRFFVKNTHKARLLILLVAFMQCTFLPSSVARWYRQFLFSFNHALRLNVFMI